MRRGVNDRRMGIAAVSARVEDGRLRIVEGRCPNLLTEAGMYRWGESEDRRPCSPLPLYSGGEGLGVRGFAFHEHNLALALALAHALAALRYLIATLDKH